MLPASGTLDVMEDSCTQETRLELGLFGPDWSSDSRLSTSVYSFREDTAYSGRTKVECDRYSSGTFSIIEEKLCRSANRNPLFTYKVMMGNSDTIQLVHCDDWL